MEKELTLRETQLILARMLSDLVSYFEKHNLRYYLVGGTLLGAVRHAGFIPWDDDIDLGMPRKDYDLFLALVKQEPVSEDYEIRSCEYGNLSIPLTEMLNRNVRIERASSAYIAEKYRTLNLFVDIIAQDGWPADKKGAQKLIRKMDQLRFMNQVARSIPYKGSTFLRTLAKIPYAAYVKLLGNERILKQIEAESRKLDYDTSEYVGSVCYGIYGMGERCLRKDVLNFEKKTFEQREYNVPGCWENYLSGIYGPDWMIPPSVDQRRSHELKAYCDEAYLRRIQTGISNYEQN